MVTSRDIMNFTMDTSATSSLISNINNLFLNDFLLKIHGLDSETSSRCDSECQEEKRRKSFRDVGRKREKIKDTRKAQTSITTTHSCTIMLLSV